MVDVLMRTFFNIFEINAKYQLDLNNLRQKYFELQKKYHPDSNDQDDIEMCLLVNEAYRILNDDVARAFYLLELENIYLNKENSEVKPNPEVLMRALEVRESLEDASDIFTLQNMQNDAEIELEKQKQDFEKFYENKDFLKSAQIAIEMQYNNKLLIEIRNKLHKLLD